MHTSLFIFGQFSRLASLTLAISLVSAGVLELLDIGADKSRSNCSAIISRRPHNGLEGRNPAITLFHNQQRSHGWARAHRPPCPGRVGSRDSCRSEQFFGGGGKGRWRTDPATNVCRKACDSCKLFVYVCFLGALSPDPTGAPPLDPAGGLPSPDPVPTLTSQPGYATVHNTSPHYAADSELRMENTMSTPIHLVRVLLTPISLLITFVILSRAWPFIRI